VVHFGKSDEGASERIRGIRTAYDSWAVQMPQLISQFSQPRRGPIKYVQHASYLDRSYGFTRHANGRSENHRC
jgi:hypothetical protein